ncbi:hypothetical protein F5X68DRAFT_226746 [Plectosphaerella plurivora]|uniref:Nephrocystin 3-like N-terminal domain-containing protein n=1 Tax=Plectosphaerella plurivora TaxID=936078 RepID=A0A9P9AFR4_9PEZI|nr:hypothetical protein F5X68DRAFT_226746 [Plectosphaerella plurivora]
MSLTFEASSPGDVSSPGVTDIRTKIQHCKDMLATLQSESDGIGVEIDPNEQLARLNIWATNMGVFSEGRKSLALRLHDADEAGKLIVRLISMFEIEIESFLALSRDALNDTSLEGGPDANSSDDDSSSGASSTSSYRLAGEQGEGEATRERDPRLPAWLSIQKTITSLQQLGQIIRKAGAQHRMERVERFKNKQENKGAYETFYRFALQKADHLFPNASIALRRRIAESIATRRSRFAYLNEHQKKLSTLNTPVPARTRPEEEAPVASLVPPTSSTPHHQGNFASGTFPRGETFSQSPVAGSVMLSNTIDTRLNTIPIRDAESSMNRPESVTSVKIPVGGLPPKPRIDHSSASFLCPYCCLIYPASEIATDEGWKNHLIQDFEPYFCTHDDCPSPYGCASSFTQWLGHMRDSHGSETQWQCWECRQISEKRTTFIDLKEFEEHLKAFHPSEIADATYNTLIQYSKVQGRDILPQGCPFCGGIPEDLDQLFEDAERTPEARTALHKHVRDHLVSIAYILAPIDMGRQNEHVDMVDDKSDAQRDKSSTRSLPITLDALDTMCDNPDCDCNVSYKDSEPPVEDEDPAYRVTFDPTTEWQFWQPISLPPNRSRIGPPVYTGHADDSKLLTYFGLRTSPVADPPMTKDERELHTAAIQSLGSQALIWGQPEKFIPDASPGTCEWIWDQKPIRPDDSGGSERTTPLTGFPEWLQAQEGSPFYWITGRLGSGKSTLMRYIFTRNNLERYLSVWRPDVTPFVIGLFANTFGAPFHQSMHWLVRAILAQALEQDPTLTSVFLDNSVQVPFKDILPPSDELELALSVFLDHCQHESRALLLLVDGLDELDASPEDIITLLTWISHQGGSNVKICAAGRPWPDFEEFFGNLPRLLMNDVVEADIEKYVTSSLDYDNVSHYTPAQLDDLSRRVSQKAQGSFLWAVVAMRTSRNYIETGSSILDVNRVIATMPLDLDDLFYHLVSGVDRDKIQYLSRTLLLKDATLGRSLHFRALGSIDSEIKLLGDKNVEAQNIAAIWLLRSTQGLLEISPGGFVEYMHPSVREWAAGALTTPREHELSLHFSPSGTLMHDFYELADDQVNIPAVSRQWRKHILANMTYHAARAANAPFPGSVAIDVANKFLKYLREAQAFWGRGDSVWFIPDQRSSTNVYEWAAALAVTEIFENVDDETWVKLRERGDRMLHRAIYGPRRSCLQDWGMSEETYFNSEKVTWNVFNPYQRQLLILKLLEMGIVVRQEHLEGLLRFETLVESWTRHNRASRYLRDVKNNFLIPALADPSLGGDYRRVPNRSPMLHGTLLLKSAAQ